MDDGVYESGEGNFWDAPLSEGENSHKSGEAGKDVDESGEAGKDFDESGEAGNILHDIEDMDPTFLGDLATFEDHDPSELGSSSQQGAAAQPPPVERVADRSEPSAQIACEVRAFTNSDMQEDMIVAYLTKKYSILSKEVRFIRSSKRCAHVSPPPPERRLKINLTQRPSKKTIIEIFNLGRPKGFSKTDFFTNISAKYNVSFNQVRNIREGKHYTHITQSQKTTAVTESTAAMESTVSVPVIIDATAMCTIFQAKLDVLARHNGEYDKTYMAHKCHELMNIYGCKAFRIYDIWQGRIGVRYTKAMWDPALIEKVSKRTTPRALKQQDAGTASSGPI